MKYSHVDYVRNVYPDHKLYPFNKQINKYTITLDNLKAKRTIPSSFSKQTVFNNLLAYGNHKLHSLVENTNNMKYTHYARKIRRS